VFAILFQKDVDDLRKLFKDAYAMGLVKKDNYKLVQMVREPDVFYNNAQAMSIIKTMDGVAWEAHHFGPGEWFYEQDKLDDLVKGINWTLSNNLDYVFYYGPFRWTNCSDYYDDVYKDWLERLWAAGAPKYANKMNYYLNAFPFGCGASRKVGPETDSYSIIGETKWLLEQVSGSESIVTPPVTTNNWHFASSMENWAGMNQITASASSSIATLTINGADPYMHSPDNLNIATSDYKYVVVTMQNQTSATTAELFWVTTTATGYDGAKMVQFPIVANDTKQRTYIIDLSANANWTGTIKQIRFDPTTASSGTVKIDVIKLVGSYQSALATIPGTIEAENFNKGGQDNAYNDADIANAGGAYRTTEGVDIETTGDATGAYNVGWVAAGEWMEYLVDVKKAGNFVITLRVSAATNGNKYHILFDDIDKTGLKNALNTGGLQTYTDNNTTVSLSAGKQLMRLYIDVANGGFNINNIIITEAPTLQTISLKQGWNLISTNVHPLDSTITTLFTGLDVQEIKTADGFWKKGQLSPFNSLQSITAGKGYFVKMNIVGTLSVSGTPISTLAYSPISILKSGWNLIGCPYQNSTQFNGYFNSTNCQTIKNFDGFWVPNGTTNSIVNFEPGKGYFIKK
jgi:hypothetical protein